VTARRDAVVRIATAGSQPKIDLSGWEKVEALGFCYTDKGQTRMEVYQRAIQAGQRWPSRRATGAGRSCWPSGSRRSWSSRSWT